MTESYHEDLMKKKHDKVNLLVSIKHEILAAIMLKDSSTMQYSCAVGVSVETNESNCFTLKEAAIHTAQNRLTFLCVHPSR